MKYLLHRKYKYIFQLFFYITAILINALIILWHEFSYALIKEGYRLVTQPTINSGLQLLTTRTMAAYKLLPCYPMLQTGEEMKIPLR